MPNIISLAKNYFKNTCYKSFVIIIKRRNTLIKILCYGDSNTYGYNPKNGCRFDLETRWSGILSSLLNEEYQVIEEGMNNRTGFVSNPDGIEQSGPVHLPLYLSKSPKIDIYILALGTNDLQFNFKTTPETMRKGLIQLIMNIYSHNNDAKIILILPPNLDETILNGYFACQFDKKSIEDSKNYRQIYKKIAKEYKCTLVDFDSYNIKPSPADGLHYCEESHKNIAKILAEKVKALSHWYSNDIKHNDNYVNQTCLKI